MRGQRRAVVEARLLAQKEAIGELVGGNPDLLGDETIEGVGLVAVAGHQRVEDRAHAGRAVSLQNIDVEGIECGRIDVGAAAARLQRDLAALWRLRIDIGEGFEVWRQSQIAEDRQAMSLPAGRRRIGQDAERTERTYRAEKAGTQLKRGAAGKDRTFQRSQKMPLSDALRMSRESECPRIMSLFDIAAQVCA